MQELPEQAGIQLANWYWKGVRQFVWERFGTSLSRSSCLNWLHRLARLCAFSSGVGEGIHEAVV